MQELKLVTKFPPGNNSYQGAKLKILIPALGTFTEFICVTDIRVRINVKT